MPEPTGDEDIELVGEEVTSVLPAVGDDLTEVLAPTGTEPTEVLPPTGTEPTEVLVAGAVAADGTGEYTREHRRRVSHRRYVMRRVGVAVATLAIVGGGIALLVALLGDDDEGAGGTDSTVPVTSEALVAVATTVPKTTTTDAPATTEASAETTTVETTEAESADPATTVAAEGTDPPEETDPQAVDGTTATDSSPPGTVVYDLDSEASCEIGQTLRRGDAGPQVQCLQERLNEVTVGGEQFAADGAFGEQTEEAVREFQEANDLGVDGVVGPATGELLGIWAG